MADYTYKVITKAQYDKFIDVSDIPANHNRKRVEAEYSRLYNELLNIKFEIALEMGKTYTFVIYGSTNLGSSRWGKWVKTVYMYKDKTLERETPEYYIFNNNLKVGKSNIMAVIGDQKDFKQVTPRKQVMATKSMDKEIDKELDDLWDKRDYKI
jgi:hypothetical protein